MTDDEWKERKDRVARYRVMQQETTDPLAAGLLHYIVLELEADLKDPAGGDPGACVAPSSRKLRAKAR